MHAKSWAATASLLAMLPVFVLFSPSPAIAREIHLSQDPEMPEAIETPEPEMPPGEMETPVDEEMSDDMEEMPDDMEEMPEPSEPSEPSEPTEPATSTMILEETGELAEGDSVLPADGSLYDEFTFSGEEGQTVTIRIESSDFDTYLAVFTPDDELLAEHDDIDETNTNSEVTVTLPSTGIYRVIVNAYDDQGRGQYLLQVENAQ